ncbi:MAG: hypothetical protein PUF48_02850 [Oscillospiraceae bacterium]|nr:hypothetical protein [Oscillospiraceae bacterium]
MSQIDDEFIRQQQAAIERMNEMQRRSGLYNGRHSMPPTPDFIKLQRDKRQKEEVSEQPEPLKETLEKNIEKIKPNTKRSSNQNTLNLPFNFLKTDKDITLILGLLLLLFNEKADRKLLLALLYILF